LLFESSAQAQFLKPTIITLVFGLGFGMFLVLLVVPSMVIMQKDFGNLFTSLRRGLTGRKVPYRAQAIFAGAVLGVVGVIGLTVAPLAITLEPSGFVTLMTKDTMSAMGATLVTFLGGLISVVILAFVAFWATGLKRA